jgi:predicted DNA-binding transcriptional regulator YafY
MRADRLVSILLLLQNHGRMTERQLSARLEVSTRTVHRDMEALGSSGVPLVADRGARGGWSLMPGYRASISALNEDEVRAIFVGAPQGLLADLRLNRASDDAALKLLSVLPSVTRRSAQIARQRIYIDLSGWKQSRDPVPMLPVIEDAVWSDRRLRFFYDRGEDCTSERLADPLGLVAKGSTWYLVARVDGDIRTYRVSRVREAFVLDESFERPDDFDLKSYWEASSTAFKEKLPRYEVVARTIEPLGAWMHSMIRFGAIDGIDGDRIRMHFDTREVAQAVLLGFGDAIEVMEPGELRDAIAEAAQRVASLYRGE